MTSAGCPKRLAEARNLSALAWSGKNKHFITLLDSGAHRLQCGEKLGSGKAGSTGYDAHADRAQPTGPLRSVV